jgi:hypothetical protein
VYYRLDESSGTTAADTSGHGITGTYASSGITHGVTGALTGDSNTAITTAASGAALTASGSIVPSGSGSHSIEVWERGTSNGALIGTGVTSSGSQNGFDIVLSGANQITLVEDTSRSWSATTPYSVEDGNWHQIVVTYAAGASAAFIYLDGQQIADLTIGTMNVITPGNGFLVGADDQGSTFPGSLDEVSVYPSALTATDIAAHWRTANNASCPSATAAGYGGAVVADSPLVYFPFSEGAGRYVADHSGNCRPGAVNGSATWGSGSLAGSGDGSLTAASGSSSATLPGDIMPSGGNARTIELWEKSNGGTGALFGVGYSSSFGGDGDWSVLLTGATTLAIEQDSNRIFSVTLPYSVTDSRWHQIDVSYDGFSTNGRNVYVDGQWIAHVAVSDSYNTVVPGNGFMVGANDQGNTFSGAISELSLYGSALTPSRITAHWIAANAKSCPTAPNTGYGGQVVSDSALFYYPMKEGSGPYTADFSGNCRPAAVAGGSSFGTGATLGDGSISGSGTSAFATLPADVMASGGGARSIELWENSTGTGALFGVGYSSSFGGDGEWSALITAPTTIRLQQDSNRYFDIATPSSVTDGQWHDIVVTYDGASPNNACVYVDGALAGCRTPRSDSFNTVVPGSGFMVGANDQGNFFPGRIGDVSLYNFALTAGQIVNHYYAGAINGIPQGFAVLAGTVQTVNAFGNRLPVSGASVQACPTNGGSCETASSATGQNGRFALVVPPGTYTVTAIAAGGSQTVGPVTVPPWVTDLALVFRGNSLLPPGATLTGPGAQQVPPTVNWNAPYTYTMPGCAGGFGFVAITGVNTQTGQPETRGVPLVETPPGSGTYIAQIPPLVPLHGLLRVDSSVGCPGHAHVLPDGGPPSGGTPLLLSGSGFSGATGVMFGSAPASSFTVVSDDLISAVAPPGTGSVGVTVTSSSGARLGVGGFNYLDVTSLDTSASPAAGGNTVTIHGHGFTNVMGVVFGLMPSPSVTVVSQDEIQAQAPVGLGTVDVQVINGFGITQPSQAAFYTYQGGPPGASAISEGVGAGDSYSATRAAQANLTNQLSDSGLFSQCDSPPTAGGIDFGRLCRFVQDAPTMVGGALADSPIVILGGGLCALTVVETGGLGCVAAGVVVGAYLGLRWAGDLFHLFVDPSGTVVDTTGNPIAGATATLLGQAGGGSYQRVDPASGSIEPVTNPETTDSAGAFDWEALAGSYEVQASAPNCHAPSNPGQAAVATSPFVIPPPAVGLLLRLECPGATAPTPQVTGLSPNTGATAGGTLVEILGSGLAGQTSVQFGSTPATHVTVLSPYALLAVAPTGTSTTDVTVTTPGGTSATGAGDRYTYFSPLAAPDGPVITSISPSAGPLVGGTLVTITGSRLGGVFAVSFANTPSVRITDVSATEIQAVAPAGIAPGRVDLTAVNAAGSSAVNSADSYSYIGGFDAAGGGGDQAIAAAGTTLNATEGASFSGAVATFTDPDPNSTASEYSATIDWGNSSSVSGTINGPVGGPFTVSGTHTYAEEGKHAVRVAITDIDTPTNTAAPTSTANAADAELTGGTLSLRSGTESVSPTTASFSFTDANAGAPASDFTATIDWGDSSSSTGTLIASGTRFDVTGSHVYADEGSHPVKVMVVDEGGSTVAATGTAMADDASLRAGLIQASCGSGPCGVTFGFSDVNPGAAVADFAATVDWGDSSSSAGVVSASGGGFVVTGSHAYSGGGSGHAITVTVTDDGGSTVDATAPKALVSLLVGLKSHKDDGENGSRFRVEFSCSSGTGTALLNGVAVTNGQVVRLKLKKSGLQKVKNDHGKLTISATSFLLVVTCSDAAGNQGCATATPVFEKHSHDESQKDAENEQDSAGP